MNHYYNFVKQYLDGAKNIAAITTFYDYQSYKDIPLHARQFKHVVHTSADEIEEQYLNKAIEFFNKIDIHGDFETLMTLCDRVYDDIHMYLFCMDELCSNIIKDNGFDSIHHRDSKAMVRAAETKQGEISTLQKKYSKEDKNAAKLADYSADRKRLLQENALLKQQTMSQAKPEDNTPKASSPRLFM